MILPLPLRPVLPSQDHFHGLVAPYSHGLGDLWSGHTLPMEPENLCNIWANCLWYLAWVGALPAALPNTVLHVLRVCGVLQIFHGIVSFIAVFVVCIARWVLATKCTYHQSVDLLSVRPRIAVEDDAEIAVLIRERFYNDRLKPLFPGHRSGISVTHNSGHGPDAPKGRRFVKSLKAGDWLPYLSCHGTPDLGMVLYGR